MPEISECSVNGYINDVKDIIEKYDVGVTDEDKANGIKTGTCTTTSTKPVSKASMSRSIRSVYVS